MKLFLASEAKHPESIVKLEKFVGGFKGKSIAYIPTATNGENHYGSWQTESGSWKLVQTLGAKVKPVVLEELKSQALDTLRGKDILWFAGGTPGYLMYWARRCQIDLHIQDLLASGSIYVGSSAGSMVCAPTLHLSEVYPDEPEHGSSVIPGLGLIDFDIFPHYEDHLLDTIKQIYKGNKLYLLKNGEAITVTDHAVEVLGEERIITQ